MTKFADQRFIHVSSDVADYFDRAAADGVSSDEIINNILDKEESYAASNPRSDPRSAVSALRVQERLSSPR